jgi:hypothetical protein
MPARKFGSGQEIPFYDYAPDLTLTTPGLVLDANFAIPTVKGYAARNTAAAWTTAGAIPGGPPLGGIIAQYSDGTTSIIVGTATHLYRLVGNTWNSIGTGTATQQKPWNFAQFADDVLATSGANTNILVAPGPTGTFANLDATAPTNATTIIAVAGFAAAYVKNEWFNSSAGTDTSWTPNTQTQSGSGFLYDVAGNITAATPYLRNQIIWKADSTWMLTYIGGTQVWGSQLLSPSVGAYSQGCVCPMPTGIAFLGTDDFYLCAGYTPQRIPNNFKEDFFRRLSKDANGNPNALQYTTSWFDPISAVCYWHYQSAVAPFGFMNMPDQYVGWNSRSGRWTHGSLNTPLVLPNTQPGMQSGFYFDSNNVLQSWTGVPTNMMIITGYQGDADNLTQLQKVRVAYTPGLYPTSQLCIPQHVYRLGDSPTVEPAGAIAADGWFSIRQTDRYHNVQINTVGPCEMMAIAYEGRLAGVR